MVNGANNQYSMSTDNYLEVEAVIVGAGPVGIATALLLSKQGVSCVLLEKHKYPLSALSTNDFSKHHLSQDKDAQTHSFDGRTLALNVESACLLDSLGCLPNDELSEEIRTIRVSQQGYFGSCVLSSSGERLSYFGLALNSIDLGNSMQRCLLTVCKDHQHLHYIEGVEIEDIEQNEGANQRLQHDNYPLRLRVYNETIGRCCIKHRILIAADGTDSQVRQHFNFPTQSRDYHQLATLTKIQHQHPHLNKAHERFLNNGILALLPTAIQSEHPSLGRQSGFVSSVVWLQNNDGAVDASTLSTEQLLRILQQHFGHQYGNFIRHSRCAFYPMREIVATRTHQANVVLIGNAAHSLHPVAGQGLNLGLKDAQQLAEQIALTGCCGDSLYHFAQQQQQRINDIRWFVNELLRQFDSANPVMALSRSLSMVAFQQCALLRRPFLYYLSGVQSSTPWFWQMPHQAMGQLIRVKKRVQEKMGMSS